MTRKDRILIASLLVLALAAAFFLPRNNDDALTAQITVEGTVVSRIDLRQPGVGPLIEVEGPLGTSTIEVKPGAIRMKYSPCPDRICMKTGWIEHPGQVIACVPNRIIITIEESIETITDK